MASEIIVATTNEHKLREIGQMLKGRRVTGNGIWVKENGKTFEANAIKKVKAIKLKPGQIGVADDSGLMVDCLGGSPGVRSARFADPPTPKNLCGKLLRLMKDCRNRNASFVCAIAIAFPNGGIRVVKGIVHGKIADKMRGHSGFGYDPVFIPTGYRQTFAEMAPAEKNRISHRGRALRKLKEIIS
ncbi:non-canonical purine NTP pyrophosphatase, RdgB/HAM1 family [candidate division WOR-1 bacterium RIFCSPHIGHO2_01_FULL_53_15]|uniref:dITP/XTP pyrophosphatase n=1 Tax=candidate division WOR-1 bacterium RIFCSPHIGHO2_01_FULL_53_15 TaxID=1802564 RepID=A0A1F4Q3K0_UNCSA|nr:MAG: non-canonical purine NTP pyrophosphatase, RdgB/HAM1 family [candidate division WOR-1 bacterium RIFCSPHIGHO2_01_FULL_53_15]OGC12578.1 MAG: non-canonical purine NTP pyrophosphatase, RdgB/HAM1 family [candidate division WOR-1 bacterium RIFCSPHIGHO2_02_FULL_53_26]